MVVLWIDDDDGGEIDGSKLHKQINPTAEIKSNQIDSKSMTHLNQRDRIPTQNPLNE